MSVERRGEVFENPSTGEHVVVLSDPDEQADGVLVAQLTVRPGGRVVTAHFHPQIRERFRVIEGKVGFLLGEERKTLGAGESAEVPPGMIHDWWHVGESDAVVVVEVDPGARFKEMVGTMYGLARDGKVDKQGLPRPLQLAVTASAYRDVMVVTSPPPWAQRLIFSVLAPVGRMRGLEPKYDEYLRSSKTVEPDPRGLALLDEHGRLKA
jgi:mannose-6-phosphate isomerase-like protein (cupin superfamily)